jgi:hypothetical protein
MNRELPVSFQDFTSGSHPRGRRLRMSAFRKGEAGDAKLFIAPLPHAVGHITFVIASSDSKAMRFKILSYIVAIKNDQNLSSCQLDKCCRLSDLCPGKNNFLERISGKIFIV